MGFPEQVSTSCTKPKEIRHNELFHLVRRKTISTVSSSQVNETLNYPKDDDMFTMDFAISGLNYQSALAQKLAMIFL